MTHFFFFVSLVLALAGPRNPAQVMTMNLTGNVLTDSREALPGAAVTLVHVPTGVRYAAAANALGRFAITNLPAGGPYLMQVGQGGYRPQTLESIFLAKGKNASFTVTLSRLAGESSKGKGWPRAVAGPPAATEAAAQERTGGAPGPAQPVAPADGSRLATAGAAAPAPAPRYYRAGRYPVRRSGARAADPIVPGHYDAPTGNYVYDTGALTNLKLPGGGTIAAVGVNSTESNLYRFLTNPQVQVDTVDLTRGWYNFDRVYFEAGKATLTAESVRQLRNVAALLRAYPQARIKLGGYTDSTGTYKVNKLLSEARARTAWASLVEMGISPARVEARGYGPRYAIAPNTTDEGRAQNRRLSVKVLQK